MARVAPLVPSVPLLADCGGQRANSHGTRIKATMETAVETTGTLLPLFYVASGRVGGGAGRNAKT